MNAAVCLSEDFGANCQVFKISTVKIKAEP